MECTPGSTPRFDRTDTGRICRSCRGTARRQTNMAETRALHSTAGSGTAVRAATGTCLHDSLMRPLDFWPSPHRAHPGRSTAARSTRCSRRSRHSCSASAGSYRAGSVGRQHDLQCTRGLAAQSRTRTRPVASGDGQHLAPAYSTCHAYRSFRTRQRFGTTSACSPAVPGRWQTPNRGSTARLPMGRPRRLRRCL